MMRNHKTGLIVVLAGIYLLVVSAFLTVALHQTVMLTQLYRVSAGPSPVTDFSHLWRLGFSQDLLIWAIVAAILFLLVRGRLRRLWPVSIIAVLFFVALNLYSGRHVLPQLLVWPAPVSLSEQYAQALAVNDWNAALRLTNQSDECEIIMEQVFQAHQAQLQQRLGDDRLETGIRDTSVKSITTFYDKPAPQGFTFMQPVPSQLITVMVEMENDKTIWLNLKMRYPPFWGTRYICGQSID